MKTNKLRRVLAIVALVFMGIFTVTFVITLVDPQMYNGVFGYVALVSVLLGVGLFLVIKFALKEQEERPEYLPKPDPEELPQNDEQADKETAAIPVEEETVAQSDEEKAQ